MKKQEKKKAIDYFPHIISLIALCFSVVVGINQIKTNNLNSDQMIREQNLINIANFDNENSVMYLLPYSDDFTLLDNTMSYPLNGKIGTKRFDKTDNHTTTDDIRNYIKGLVLKKSEVVIPLGAFLDFNGYPILIGTKYIHKGKTYEVVALYYVSFYAIALTGNSIEINLKNIEYIRNMDKKINPSDYLMAVFYRNFKMFITSK